MTTLRFIATTFLLCIASTTSFAESPSRKSHYYGGNVGLLEYEDIGGSFDTKAVYARYGHYFLLPWLSAEARIALRLGSDSVNRSPEGRPELVDQIDVELDYIYGLFTKAEVELGSSAMGYIALGYAQTRITASFDGGASSSNSEAGFAWGAGLDFGADGYTNFNIEYTNYLDLDNVSVSGFSLGFVNKF